MKAENRKLVTRGVEAEPSAGSGEIPIIFFGVLAGLLFLGLLYLDRFAGGYNSQVYRPYDSYKQVLALQPLDPVGKSIANGKKVYEIACQLCHQPNGLGTPGQFPPLDGSEWVTGPVQRLARIPQHGVTGPIKVNGQDWNAAMPAIGGGLSDDEMADLLTFIRQNWSNKASAVKVDEIKKMREAEANRTQPWTADELLKIQ